MTIQEYRAIAATIAAGLCAAKPEFPLGTRSDSACDTLVLAAFDITDRIVQRSEQRFDRLNGTPRVPASDSVLTGPGRE
jgi:hypothetical protein